MLNITKLKGEDALNAINNYFSQLSETDAVRNLADSVRSARDRMDAARINLNTASDTDLMIEQALNGNFDQLIEYLKTQSKKIPSLHLARLSKLCVD